MQVRPERQIGSGLDWARESNLQILNFTLKIIKVKVKLKVAVVSDSLWPHGLYSRWNSPGQNTRVGSLSLLQGILPTQGLNPGLPYCKWMLYQLSHKGSSKGQGLQKSLHSECMFLWFESKIIPKFSA